MEERPLAWAVTGAGHFLEEVFSLMKEVSSKRQVTCFLSRAAEEVLRIYGLWECLGGVSDGSHYAEVLTDRSDGASAVHAGRLARGVYSALVVAPATANTVAKICAGIADTLVTNAVAQALKGEVPVLILPTDQTWTSETKLPVRVDSNVCVGCTPCMAEESCEAGAFKLKDGKGTIDYLACVGCRACVEDCIQGAVRYGEKLKVRAREVDLENVEKLRGMEGVKVLKDPEELRRILMKNVVEKT